MNASNSRPASDHQAPLPATTTGLSAWTDEINNPAELSRVRRRSRELNRAVRQGSVVFNLVGEDVHRNAEVGHTTTSCCCFGEGAPQVERNLRGVVRHGCILGDAANNGELIHILKGVAIPKRRMAHAADRGPRDCQWHSPSRFP